VTYLHWMRDLDLIDAAAEFVTYNKALILVSGTDLAGKRRNRCQSFDMFDFEGQIAEAEADVVDVDVAVAVEEAVVACVLADFLQHCGIRVEMLEDNYIG